MGIYVLRDLRRRCALNENESVLNIILPSDKTLDTVGSLSVLKYKLHDKIGPVHELTSASRGESK